MDRLHYEEMNRRLQTLIREKALSNKRIYLFGHCNATETLADLLFDQGYFAECILDNNPAKYGNEYRGIPIKPPDVIIKEPHHHTVVCIVSRAYESMAGQLKNMGYRGSIQKLADYNSFAEYSLSEDTVKRMYDRAEHGIYLLEEMKRKYPGSFRFLCPFSALGDVYYAVSYLPYFLKKRGTEKCVIGVVGNACAEVAELFFEFPVVIFSQRDMDELIQAALYTEDKGTFFPHQDRPYAVNLHRALYIKCIPLETIYCCGVYGLKPGTAPCKPRRQIIYSDLDQIHRGKAVILSPYAKSVTALPASLWEQIVVHFTDQGYQCMTNVAENEQPLPGTMPICPSIRELKSVVERAGTFIGIRSGICDVIKEAACRKIALYPDYQYCDTEWKAVDMYAMSGWKNIVIRGDCDGNRTGPVYTAESMDF